MMTRYQTPDGELIEANSPLAIAEALRIGSRFDAHKPLQDFVKDMAARVNVSVERPVRHDTPDNFVSDLLAIGWLKKVV